MAVEAKTLSRFAVEMVCYYFLQAVCKVTALTPHKQHFWYFSRVCRQAAILMLLDSGPDLHCYFLSTNAFIRPVND